VYLRWPYHAAVMKRLLAIRRSTVAMGAPEK
jgi:hypothetical protein